MAKIDQGQANYAAQMQQMSQANKLANQGAGEVSGPRPMLGLHQGVNQMFQQAGMAKIEKQLTQLLGNLQKLLGMHPPGGPGMHPPGGPGMHPPGAMPQPEGSADKGVGAKADKLAPSSPDKTFGGGIKSAIDDLLEQILAEAEQADKETTFCEKYQQMQSDIDKMNETNEQITEIRGNMDYR